MLDKQSRNLGTDRTITGIMVVNIKSMAYVCSNSFLSIFLRKDTVVFWKISLLNWLTKLTHQTLCREKTIGEVFWRQWRHVDWTLKNCYWNSVLLYSYHWISSGCNKDLIYRNNFGIDYYYCSYFHHYHYSCRFYDTLFFYCSCLRDCVGVLFVIIMVLVWSSPLLLSFL